MNINQVIKGYFYWCWYYLYKPYRKKHKKEAQERIKICESCEYFWKHSRSCEICSCFMDIKVKSYFDLDENEKSIGRCPELKW